MAFLIKASGSLVGLGTEVPDPGWYWRRRLVEFEYVLRPDSRSKWRPVEVLDEHPVGVDKTAVYEWLPLEKPPD